MSWHVNAGSAWKEVSEIFVNMGGEWKTVDSVQCNISGIWKECGVLSVLDNFIGTYNSNYGTGPIINTVDMTNCNEVLAIASISASGSADKYIVVDGNKSTIHGDDKKQYNGLFLLRKNGLNVDVYYLNKNTLEETFFVTVLSHSVTFSKDLTGGSANVVLFKVS